MAAETQGTIFDIKRYAIHDGAGIRTTVFLKGCPIRCRWCANPESQKTAIEIAYLKGECLQCGRCVNACPQKALHLPDAGIRIDRAACKSCCTCAGVCPADALQLMGRTINVKDLYAEVASDRPFWERSGGGITVSGGEPLAQANFVKEFLKLSRENYVHTAMETCLQVPTETLKEVLPYVNQVICDIKIMDDWRHKEFTGASNKLILKNIAELLQQSTEVLVRMPLIPGVNDDRKNLEETGSFLEMQRPNIHLELLPYHRLGEEKYNRLDRTYEMQGILSPTNDEMARAVEILKAFKITLKHPALGEPLVANGHPDNRLESACPMNPRSTDGKH